MIILRVCRRYFRETNHHHQTIEYPLFRNMVTNFVRVSHICCDRVLLGRLYSHTMPTRLSWYKKIATLSRTQIQTSTYPNHFDHVLHHSRSFESTTTTAAKLVTIHIHNTISHTYILHSQPCSLRVISTTDSTTVGIFRSMQNKFLITLKIHT